MVIGSTHGCSDTLKTSDAIFLNGYTVELSADSIFCFDGNESIDATLRQILCLFLMLIFLNLKFYIIGI
ncbi:MAG: hypothetical protein CM15mP107_3530 [Bacteroidota bacterium]|nr:MAG: hypothetical protein CM15mP107_3530 [Bacteroidota bacterium]